MSYQFYSVSDLSDVYLYHQVLIFLLVHLTFLPSSDTLLSTSICYGMGIYPRYGDCQHHGLSADWVQNVTWFLLHFCPFFDTEIVDCLKYIYLSVVSVFFLCCNLVDSILVLAFQLPVCRSFFHFMIANQSLFCSHYCKCFNRAIELIFSSFWQNNSAFLSSQILIK